MNATWDAFLREHDSFATETAVDPSHLISQVQALRSGSVAAVLTDMKLFRVTGEDAQVFLQGQLSSDIREITATRAQYSTYSTAKGRMLATFLIWSYQGAYYLLLSADLADAVIKRLRMFVMRSRVVFSEVDDEWTVFGASGPQATALLQPCFAGANTVGYMDVRADSGRVLIGLEDDVYVLVLDSASDMNDVLQNNDCLEWISAAAWAVRDIDAGIAWVRMATTEQFVPQMANMELIGAVSFKKGCYPGQEIVARSQYLGKLKRRLFKVESAVEMVPGARLYNGEIPGQSIGMIVSAVPVAAGRYEGLAVVQFQAWETGVFLDEECKIQINQLVLPYLLEPSDE